MLAWRRPPMCEGQPCGRAPDRPGARSGRRRAAGRSLQRLAPARARSRWWQSSSSPCWRIRFGGQSLGVSRPALVAL